MRVVSLCAGAGGLDLGLRLAMPGARGVAFVEREAYAAATLVARMETGCLHPAAVWSDLATFDGRPWRGRVHIVTSGDPCQPNSVAGKRGGADDDRFLIDQVIRIVDEIRPVRLFRENVPGNADGQLAAIVPALERMGYRVAAGIFSSGETGNSHGRRRLFIMADRAGDGSGGIYARPWQSGFAAPDFDGCGAELENTGSARPGDYDRTASHRDGGAMERRGTRVRRRDGPDGTDGLDAAVRAVAHAVGPVEAGWVATGGEAQGGRAFGQSGRSGGALADAERAERRPHDASCNDAGQDGDAQREESSGRAGKPGSSVVDADSADAQGRVADQLDAEGREIEARHARLAGGSVGGFPIIIPRPSDARWPGLLRTRPEFAPAIDKEAAERLFRRGFDALAHRVDRLRLTGNGVDPVVAAYAWLCLDALFAADGAASAGEPV